MNEYQIIVELRNILQATISVDEIVEGNPIRVVKPVISDEAQRNSLTDKLVTLLNNAQPIAQ